MQTINKRNFKNKNHQGSGRVAGQRRNDPKVNEIVEAKILVHDVLSPIKKKNRQHVIAQNDSFSAVIDNRNTLIEKYVTKIPFESMRVNKFYFNEPTFIFVYKMDIKGRAYSITLGMDYDCLLFNSEHHYNMFQMVEGSLNGASNFGYIVHLGTDFIYSMKARMSNLRIDPVLKMVVMRMTSSSSHYALLDLGKTLNLAFAQTIRIFMFKIKILKAIRVENYVPEKGESFTDSYRKAFSYPKAGHLIATVLHLPSQCMDHELFMIFLASQNKCLYGMTPSTQILPDGQHHTLNEYALAIEFLESDECAKLASELRVIASIYRDDPLMEINSAQTISTRTQLARFALTEITQGRFNTRHIEKLDNIMTDPVNCLVLSLTTETPKISCASELLSGVTGVVL